MWIYGGKKKGHANRLDNPSSRDREVVRLASPSVGAWNYGIVRRCTQFNAEAHVFSPASGKHEAGPRSPVGNECVPDLRKASAMRRPGSFGYASQTGQMV